MLIILEISENIHLPKTKTESFIFECIDGTNVVDSCHFAMKIY